jgi:hypothetical protein
MRPNRPTLHLSSVEQHDHTQSEGSTNLTVPGALFITPTISTQIEAMLASFRAVD